MLKLTLVGISKKERNLYQLPAGTVFQLVGIGASPLYMKVNSNLEIEQRGACVNLNTCSYCVLDSHLRTIPVTTSELTVSI